jgi:spore germination protein YaaH
MRTKLIAMFFCLVCLSFLSIVGAMVMTYEQKSGWGEPGPFPYSAGD